MTGSAATGSIVPVLSILVILVGVGLLIAMMPSFRDRCGSTTERARDYFYGPPAPVEQVATVEAAALPAAKTKSPEELAAMLDFSLDEFSKRFGPPGNP